MPLFLKHSDLACEAGIDEAGRGCLAGPVVAAAVVLGPAELPPDLNDSKKLTEKARLELREWIWENALGWGLGMKSAGRIDEINILQATMEAMHEALDTLPVEPNFLLIDGNKFRPWRKKPFACMVKGDSRFASIAAASILAKTYRDEVMALLAEHYPVYGWTQNKGYPTAAHRQAILKHGPTPYHRRSFNWQPQLKLL